MKKPNGVPEWFCLENYKDTALLTPIEWYANLYRRMAFFALQSRYGNTCPPSQKTMELIKTNPVMRRDEARLYSESRFYYGKTTIKPLENRDVNDLFEQLEENSCSFFSDYRELRRNEPEKARNTRYNNEQLKSFFHSPFSSAYSFDKAFSSVNLRATDEHLIQDFKSFLAKARESHPKTVIKRRFTELDYKEWSEYKVLPYLDLKIWSSVSGYRLTNTVIGNTLFPKEFEIDTTERIRRTTKPKAEMLLNSSIIDAFGVQVQKELE
ncbi:DUF6387 family protein [Methylomonas methanica]|uniref:DUF6387 family protein n=1 Tax=Methylomonas methanica TaxID=421 RepID=UPI000AA776D9|nr:DUF6387 family protein [Methylomonas methanica]